MIGHQPDRSAAPEIAAGRSAAIGVANTVDRDRASGCNEDGSTGSTARIAAGTTAATVNLKQETDKWDLLGEFEFAAGRSGYVELSNLADGNVIADAVRFERVKAAPGPAAGAK